MAGRQAGRFWLYDWSGGQGGQKPDLLEKLIGGLRSSRFRELLPILERAAVIEREKPMKVLKVNKKVRVPQSLLYGAASVISVMGTPASFAVSRSRGFLDDYDALSSDWKAVGRDVFHAIKKVASTSNIWESHS
jgi:hypothetical protein